jgi:hypothetical protein
MFDPLLLLTFPSLSGTFAAQANPSINPKTVEEPFSPSLPLNEIEDWNTKFERTSSVLKLAL